MDVQLEKTGPCNCKLSITVPKVEVDRAFTKAYRTVAKSARIPGFRPGKAPRHVLDMHFGEQLRSDVENDLVRGSLTKAIEEQKVVVVATPRIETGDLKRGNDFSYTAEVETQPDIELKKFEGLEVNQNEVEITGADIDAELEKVRQQSVQLAPVLDRDYIKPGDIVVVDYQGTVGGSPLQGAKADDSMLEIGEDEFFPGISEALMGAKVPSRAEVPIDFPSDHQVEGWRDVKATFHVELKELKKRDLPDLDDDFAKDLGEESLDDLRTKITAAVKAKKEHEAKQDQRKSLLEALVAANPFDVPPSMVSEQVDRMIVDAAQRVRMMMGPQFNMDDLDVDGLREKNRDVAEHQVRSGLLLLEVSKAAGLEVSDEQIDKEVDRLASAAGDNAERIRAQYGSGEDRQHLKYKLLEDSTIDWLLAHAAGATPEEKSDQENTTEVAAAKPEDEAAGGEQKAEAAPEPVAEET